MPRLAFYSLLGVSLMLLGGLLGIGLALHSGAPALTGFQLGGQVAAGTLATYVAIFKAIPAAFGQMASDELVPAVIEGIGHIFTELIGNGLISGLIHGVGFVFHVLGELAVGLLSIL